MKTVAFFLTLQLAVAAPSAQSEAPALPRAPKGLGFGNPREPQLATAGAKAAQASAPPPETPGDCKLLPSDAQWPALAAWKTAIPRVAVRGHLKAGKTAPDYKILASTAAEVQQAVKFASDNNIRLTVLNSGHDFLGRNDAPDGLRVSVTDIKGVRISKSFTPTAEGVAPINNKEVPDKIDLAPNELAYVTFGAGLSTQLLNNALAPTKLFTLGAAHGEVSVAGGWGQTAGHSPLGPSYGLGADVAMEYKVVTADGKLVVANEVANPDLFWALRGGGGGTYGIVVEATIKAFRSPKMTLSTWFLNTTGTADKSSMYKATAYLHSQIPDLVDKSGVSGYYYVFPNAIKSVFFTSGDQVTADQAKAVWSPILDRMSNMPGMDNKTLVAQHNVVPSYKSFFDAAFGSIESMASMPGMSGGIAGNGAGGATPKSSEKPCTEAATKRDVPLFRRVFEEAGLTKRHGPGEEKKCNAPKSASSKEKRHGPEEKEGSTETKPQGIFPMDSRLLGRDHLIDPSLADALEKAMPLMQYGQLRGNVVGGGKVWTAGNEKTTSVNPAWRKAYVHLIATGAEQPNADSLRKLAPDMGAYANEASRFQPAYKTSFWGPNYIKLSAIKTKYDPHGLFWTSPGINADEWVIKEDNRLCRAPKISGISKPAAELAAMAAPVTDNKNIAFLGPSDADGPEFPLWVVDGKVVPGPKKKEGGH